jgi:oxygen-independent coproporphyrinogen-3 oxidase
MNGWGVYVHLPFCATRCAYCDFAIHLTTDPSKRARYEDAVIREWERRALESGRVVSIYFGGGTPSLTAPSVIARILAAIGTRAAVAADVEVTLEANPGTVTPETLQGYRRAGVNRLSLGVQAVQTHLLQAMRRPHDFQAACDAVRWARAAGFRNLNLDAIYGYPGQTEPHVRETLTRLLDLAPEHLSLYQLQVEPGTALARDVRRGRAALPDEDATADMADLARDLAEAAGLRRYEVSNFARAGYESRHNRLYWNQGRYVGIGMGAHSFDGSRRFWNVRSLSGYLARIEDGQAVALGSEELTADDLMSEFVWLGLRQVDGIALADFGARFGTPLEDAFGATVERLQRQGFVSLKEGRLALSPRGFEVMNRILPEFLPETARSLP